MEATAAGLRTEFNDASPGETFKLTHINGIHFDTPLIESVYWTDHVFPANSVSITIWLDNRMADLVVDEDMPVDYIKYTPATLEN